VSDQAQLRQFSDAQSARAGAERYQRCQWEIRSGRAGRDRRPRPREFDENGFPIHQRDQSFVERVARLLNPA